MEKLERHDRIYVAGHRGLVGSAIVRRLKMAGFSRLILRSRKELDLTNQAEVRDFFALEKPKYVFLAAAKVGGIHANATRPAEFLLENLQIQTNVIEAACLHGVGKLLFLGSSCIYPRAAPQPLKEEFLLTGPLEPTNEWYAIAKIAGLKLCQALRRQHDFHAISAMPTNLYGPGDNFSLSDSHVLPALIRKFHEAKVAGEKQVVVWGTGLPRREFLHVDDLADAALFLMEQYEGEAPINVGWGEDLTIAELAALIADVVGFAGEMVFDVTRPDGMLRKVLDTSRLAHLGWQPKIALRPGIVSTYRWYVENAAAHGRFGNERVHTALSRI